MSESRRLVASVLLMLGLVVAVANCVDDTSHPPTASLQPAETRASAADPDGELEEHQTWIPEEHPLEEFISPPVVRPSAYACSQQVLVEGCLENAQVSLFINGTLEATKNAGEGGLVEFSPSQPLAIGDEITAQQTVTDQNNNQVTSDLSAVQPVVGWPDDTDLPTPRIRYSLWECGYRVGVDGFVPGMRLTMENADTSPFTVPGRPKSLWPSGRHNVWPVYTGGSTPLEVDAQTNEGEQITAFQEYCPQVPDGVEQGQPGYVYKKGNDAPSKEVNPSPATPLPPLESTVDDGTEVIHIDDAYLGSIVKTFEGDDGDLESNTIEIDTTTARWPDYWRTFGYTFDDSAHDYGATQELCAGTKSKLVPAKVRTPQEIEELLNTVDILEPICPEANAIRVRTYYPKGVITLEYSYRDSGGVLHQVSLGMATVNGYGSDITTVNIRPKAVGILGQGASDKEVRAIHYYNHPDGVLRGVDTAGIGAGDAFKVLGASEHTDYATGQSVTGFMKDEPAKSRGPKFEFVCCGGCECEGCQKPEESPQSMCLDNGQPREVTVTITDESGEFVKEVTLTEKHSGFFTGRWDWFIEQEGNQPPTAGTYTATVNGNEAVPCEAEPKEFELLAEETRSGLIPGPEGLTLSLLETRAMWVWNGSENLELLEDSIKRNALFAFTQAPHGFPEYRMNRLFFQARKYEGLSKEADRERRRNHEARTLLNDPLTEPYRQQQLRAFLKEAHRKGIAVEYLDGDPTWATPDQEDKPRAICDAVVAFNKTGDINERFDGINFNIEPNNIPRLDPSDPDTYEWHFDTYDSNNNLISDYNLVWIKSLVESLRYCEEKFLAYQENSGHKLTLSTTAGENFHHFVNQFRARLNEEDPAGVDGMEPTPIDYVTVMNYLDNDLDGDPNTSDNGWIEGKDFGDGDLSGGVVPNLEDWTNVPVLFGAETHPGVADYLSFAQEGYDVMHQELQKVFDRGYPNTVGIAVHHYKPQAYAAMCASSPTPPPGDTCQ